jgi:hypothetical protein
MTEMNRHELMLQAFTELAPEIRAARGLGAAPRLRRPALNGTLEEFLPLPGTSLFMGVANDGLPVLLNIADSVPGPVLIAGDEGSGKSALLRVIAVATDMTHRPENVQYGVVTRHPEDWGAADDSPNSVGVFPAESPGAEEFIHSLFEWAHSNHGDRQSVLLLIDDLSALAALDAETRQQLRWLLLRGPARRAWPIVTINPRRVPDVHPWTAFFHTRLFGRIGDPGDISNLAGGAKPRLEGLVAGSEFMLREGSDWLKFWIPSMD